MQVVARQDVKLSGLLSRPDRRRSELTVVRPGDAHCCRYACVARRCSFFSRSDMSTGASSMLAIRGV